MKTSVCSVWVMPSTTAFFPCPYWNVNVKTGAGAAILDHEMEAIC